MKSLQDINFDQSSKFHSEKKNLIEKKHTFTESNSAISDPYTNNDNDDHRLKSLQSTERIIHTHPEKNYQQELLKKHSLRSVNSKDNIFK